MPYKEKMLFQFMLFPEGISYNKQKDRCRTTKINSVIRYFAELAGDWEAKKIGESKFFFDLPDCVPEIGLKPKFKTEDFQEMLEVIEVVKPYLDI